MTIEPVALAGHREVIVRDEGRPGRAAFRHSVLRRALDRRRAQAQRGTGRGALDQARRTRRSEDHRRTWRRSSQPPSSGWNRPAEPCAPPASGAYVRHDVQTHPDHCRHRCAAALASAPARAIEGGPAPFDNDLQRLAEILGALHYLRSICGANEGQRWRNEMQALIDAEALTGERRSRMVAELQPRLPRLPADLPHLHAGGRPRDPPLSRRRREDLPRDHRPLRQLTAPD